MLHYTLTCKFGTCIFKSRFNWIGLLPPYQTLSNPLKKK